MNVLSLHNDPVTAVDFSCDGTLIVSSSYDGSVRTWDCASGKLLKTLVPASKTVASYATYSPNSRYVLVSTLDSSLRIWDHESGKVLKTYGGHSNTKYCIFSSFVATHPRKHIVSGSEDGHLYIWDLQSKQIIQRLDGHTDVVVAVDAHPIDPMLASGAFERDCTVKLWRTGTSTCSVPPITQSQQPI